ncbi:tol-pal system protein YbgF [Marinomonas sp. M1K-6]|uniref:Cell division coordinator CpoB n=1 Tax=Marinomonas profundi TaxID=2726122 RepID=A0A847R5P8_9GAMM|nr:tol-pal system protein YbgF [Marinomonas profundi]NLQ16367.1 tol-pal system protein YbgF [Marinomonas profundi]UDV03058.1 tol-pal system protein YbgF [Marinomonas profundi]
MINKNVKVRSFALALCFTAPFAMAEIQQVSGGLSTGAAADLLFQVETLQQEVQQLRGLLEEQGHELKLMKESQRNRYIDLDKRISLLMSASAANEFNQPSPSAQSEQKTSPRNAVDAPMSAPIPFAPVNLQPPTVQSQQAYNNAYDLIRQRKFDDAEMAFSAFVKEYPSNTLTGNGFYWLGEIKLVQGKSQEAIEAFSTVTQKFPGHNKEQDALYKLGTVSDQAGDTEKARSYLQDVIKRFPNSKAAQLAAGYLSKIK